MKVDPGSYAVFIEQGSSASQIKAGKVMDINPDCQVRQDKQLMQYRLTPRSKWNMLHRY